MNGDAVIRRRDETADPRERRTARGLKWKVLGLPPRDPRTTVENGLMRISLSEQQREHLRGVRETQLTNWRAHPFIVDDLFVQEDVVRLMSGMGGAAYLGLDGRVWVGNLGEGLLPQVLEDPKDVASCLVRWAGAVGLPELVDALPPMPDDGEICSLCKGTREMPEEIIPSADDGFRYFCRRCGGLGWTRKAEHTGEPEPPITRVVK